MMKQRGQGTTGRVVHARAPIVSVVSTFPLVIGAPSMFDIPRPGCRECD